MACSECHAVCVWEAGGVYHPSDDRLRKDIADALGAGIESVQMDGYEADKDGAWLRVRIHAPFVPENWAGK